jgi:hypothetical protein
MKNSTIKVDFFRVVVDGTYTSLESLIEHVNALSDDESRCLDLGENAKIRLQKTFHDNNFYKGDFVRIKMDDVPIKASGGSSVTEPIDLKDDEGIGKETAFIYHIPSQILLLQRTYLGVSCHNFSRYFQERTPSPCAVNLNPVLDGDVLERIKNLSSIKKIDLKFDRPQNKSFLSSPNRASDAAFDLIEFYDAPQITLQLSVGMLKKSELAKSRVVDTVKSLFSSNNSNGFKKGHVTGINEDNRQEIIDLSKVTMQHEISISYPGRSISYEQRKDALIEAWVKKKDILKLMYEKVE